MVELGAREGKGERWGKDKHRGCVVGGEGGVGRGCALDG